VREKIKLICAGGGAEEVSRAMVHCAWAKFREQAPVLTSRGESHKVKGTVYRAGVRSVLRYASETCPIKVEDMARFERTERMMVRWMCGDHWKNRTVSLYLQSAWHRGRGRKTLDECVKKDLV